MTTQEIKEFYKAWIDYSKAYSKICPDNHPAFPDTIQKAIVMSYDSTLKLNTSKTYDFVGNIELKSTTKINGNIVFSKNQTSLKRILFLEISLKNIMLYDISTQSILEKINSDIGSKKINHNLSKIVRNNGINGIEILKP